MTNLMGKRKIFFILSAVLILIGVVGLLVNGLQLDINFQGGTQILLEMDNDDYLLDEAQEYAEEITGKPVTAKKMKTYSDEKEEKTNVIMLQIGADEYLSTTESNLVIESFMEKYELVEDENRIIDVQSVDPIIGDELLQNGLLAAFIAAILIVLYVWVRFSVMNGLSAAAFALVALIHDALIMVSVYTVFKLPINQSFIAALLTILGYSLNDTIVIYDRIRENTRQFKKSDVENLVNTSVYQTLSRSINTTTTTVIAIGCVYVLASINNISALKDFAFPLIIGMISGTYSSIFVASPLWMMWKKHKRTVLIKR